MRQPSRHRRPAPRVAEFFAGIGLVRLGLEAAGFDVIWANDIEPTKAALYAENFGSDHFVLGDVRDVRGRDLPTVDLATASFPCVDLSLAGNRLGLHAAHSGMFWEFARVLEELGDRRPQAVLLENVPSFGTSRRGEDLTEAVAALNELGYSCDLFVANARRFVPQSRERLFIVGALAGVSTATPSDSEVRPPWLRDFLSKRPHLITHRWPLELDGASALGLADVVERLAVDDDRWWSQALVERFVSSLTPLQASRLRRRIESSDVTWATAYRRTRNGATRWEIRRDDISGCLRTPRGGSSRQALVEAGRGRVRIRWMTPREYARLQGVDDSYSITAVTPNQALFGFGDAVCVPVISWIAMQYLRPLMLASVSQPSIRTAA